MRGVFVCDVLNEDFTRILSESKEDIHATGVCLIHETGSEQLGSNVVLCVTEMTTNVLYAFNLQGRLLYSKKIEMDSFLTQHPVSTFDPVCTAENNSHASINQITGIGNNSVSLGKLFINNDGFLISTSSNHIYVIEPREAKLILWNDEFHKIHTIKLISNYAFVWNGSKVNIISMTQVLPYSEQLIKADVLEPFERWVKYCLYSTGWRNNLENPVVEKNSRLNFCSLMFGMNGTYDEENQLHYQLSQILPFDPKEVLDDDNPFSWDPLWKPYKTMASVFKQLSYSSEISNNPRESDQWEAIQSLYSAYGINSFTSVTAGATLREVMENIFLFSSKESPRGALQKITREIELETLQQDLMDYLEFQISSNSQSFSVNIHASYTGITFFQTFIRQSMVVEWFREYGMSENDIYRDSCIADLYLLISPLLRDEDNVLLLKKLGENNSIGFPIWLVISTSQLTTFSAPYASQIRSLFTTDEEMSSYTIDVLSYIYLKLSQEDAKLFAMTLIYLVTTITFVSIRGENSDTLDMESLNRVCLHYLVKSYPFKHLPKKDVLCQLMTIWKTNEYIFKMFQTGYLFFHKANELCSCGIPLNCFPPHQNLSTLDTFVNTVGEGILEFLLQRYYQHLPRDRSEITVPIAQTAPFHFAMKAHLVEPIILELSNEIADEILIELILRYSCCAILDKIRLTKLRLNLLLRKRDYILCNHKCENCGTALPSISRNRNYFSIECIGFWIYSHCGSIGTFQKFIDSIPLLNQPDTFSLAFYQLIVSEEDTWNQLNRHNGSKISCIGFHQDNTLDA